MAEQVVAEYKLQVDEAVNSLGKLQQQLQQTENAAKKSGKVANDSFLAGSNGAKRLEQELNKTPKTLAEMELKLQRLRELLRDDTKIGTDGFKRVRAEIEKTEKEIKQLNAGIEKTGKEASGLGGIFKKVGGFLAAAFAVDRVVSFTKEVVTLAAQSEGVERAFRRIGSPELLQGLRDATRGTVSDLQLMQNAVKASNFKIPLENLAALFKFAQARARETGESVDYLVDSIILGIGRKSPLILDNLGISAVELRNRLKGVGVEAANVGDIATIIGDIATEELAKMGDQADTTADQMAQLATNTENLKVALGKLIAEQSKPVIQFFSNISRALQQDITELQRFKDQISGESGLSLLNRLTEESARLVELETEATEKAGKVRDAEYNKIAQRVDFQRELIAAIEAELNARVSNNKEIEITPELIEKEIAAYKKAQEETNIYVRSIVNLNAELKDLQKSFNEAEIGSKEWIDLIEKMFNKTEELNDVNEELAWRLAVLEGAFDNYESIDTKGIDNFTDSVEKASAAIKKAREEAQTKSLQLTGDEFIDPNLGFPNASSIINTQSDQETFDESLSQWNSYASSVAAIGDSISQIQAAFNQQELDALNYQLQQGEITRDEYDQRRRQIMEQQAEDRKAAAIFDATVTGFSAVVQAYNTDPTGILAGITAAVVAAQIAAISATPIPQYAKGVIDLKGAGTETSDSIHAKLSRGESVMTAKETRKYKEELWAIRRGNFEDLIITKYVKPMIDESLFKGFADLSKSAQLNGITANLKDHNILHGLDRLRQSQQQGFMYLAEEQRKLFKKQSRGGYRA